MRALRLVGLVSAGLLAVLILVLLWLTLTASGLRTGLALTARLVPGELRWDGVDGRLAGPLAIRGLRFTGEAGDYRLERLDFDWSPAALSRGALIVERLHLEGVRLAPAPAPAAPADAATEFQPPDIRLPLRIVLRDIRVESLEFIPPEGQPLTLEHLYLDAGTETHQLQLQQLDLALPGIGLQASGDIALAAAGETQLAFHWQAELPDLPPYAGAGELSGNWNALLLTHRLERPAAAALELRLQQPLAALQWSLDLSLPETALNTFAPALPPDSLALVLQAEGDLNQARFEARLNSDHPQLQDQPLELQGRASHDGWTDYRLEDAELRLADSRLQLAGHWSLDAARGRLELDWPALHWPPANPAFSARAGSLVWEGGVEAFSLNLQSALAGEALPETQLELQGRGDAAGFDLTRLQAGLLGGELQADGRIGWSDGLDWQLQLAAQGIDPGRHWPDWPGELAARIESSGDMRNEALTAQVTLQTLDGRLRGLPISGGGSFDTAPGGWRFANLELRTGDNRLALHGGPGMPEGLDWQLDFPDLAASLPGMNGALQGQGRLRGDWPQLRATGAIEVQELGLAQLTLARAMLDFDAGLDGVTGPLT
ncbi:translocation/assembly module TamB domain-containing protein [Thiohalobacter thiocyanaticus]|uniref:Translocation/assembly module TamB n=1 Tax=Thiohalobacter thiocyanaticus TaxID=585455 RepID=A0A426QG00_9GAMM|nr:hypothetical protein [Thiohalobacter thiocyanaticus]RRQ20680.1 hypothetical protein D6C00_00905 [Thiohalobacter thiocyanaticus]